MPTPILAHKSPFHCVHHYPPDLLSLKIFGCACFSYLRPYNKQKFNFHISTCVFVGYCKVHKGFKFLLPFGRLYISMHVIFNENEFSLSLFSNVPHPPPVSYSFF
ncbi:hypothetical protein ACOSQ3_027385 [Xanthoceras sorbifolium]